MMVMDRTQETSLFVEGGLVTATEVDISHRRTSRTVNLARHLDHSVCLADRVPCLLHPISEALASCPSACLTSVEGTVKLPDSQGHHGEDSAGHRPGQSCQNIIPKPQWLGDHQPEPSLEPICPGGVAYSEDATSEDIFNSSFSFIQQSLVYERSFWEKYECKTSGSEVEQSAVRHKDTESSGFNIVEMPESDPSGKLHNLLMDKNLVGVDLDVPWHNSVRYKSYSRHNMPDSDTASLDTEVPSLFAVDFSDSASASSRTSGYESATLSSDQRWNVLMTKCEGVLQECLQKNRTNSRITSMMFKLQKLQQKAVLDDDYDTAERFSKKLDELMKEKSSLQLGLPSRHPKITNFLEHLRTTIQTALRRTDPECRQTEESSIGQMRPQQFREQLLQEKKLIQREMKELQFRLEELQKRSLALEEQLTQEELRLETVEMERGCSPAQLCLLGRAVEDMILSKHRIQISLSPLPCITRLQKQEQVLTLCIKEATAKVVTGQRLGGSLRRKVSESETQLLALHEAKLAAISGNDFSTAKELKAEMRLVYGEREHLEGLAKRLQTLNTVSAQDLASLKEQHSQLKKELQKREAQYEQNLKNNIIKYTAFLEDRLHRSELHICGLALRRIWEADLEACHLLLHGLQLHVTTYSEPEDLLPTPKPSPQVQTFTEMEADCAILATPGDCWGSEANLPNSKFTKKLEEFLFCWEDSHPEDLHNVKVVEMTEHCELISKRLLSLEEQLQSALQNSDQDITLSLEKEVQKVKTTLQDMLSQLKKSAFDEEEKEQKDEEQFYDVDDRETLEVKGDN